MSAIVRFTLQCEGVGKCLVFVEPEGAELPLSSGNTFSVEIRGGDEDDPIELTYRPDGITIWARARAETIVRDSSGEQLNV